MALGFILSPWGAALPWVVLLSLPLGLLLSLGLVLCLGWLVLLEVAALGRVSASVLAGSDIFTLKAQTNPIVELVACYSLHSSWFLNLAQGSPSAVPSHSWSAYIQKGHFLGGSGCIAISFVLAHSWPICSNHRARPWNNSAAFSRSSSARFRLSAGKGMPIIPPPSSRSQTRHIVLLFPIVVVSFGVIVCAGVAVGSYPCID